MKVPNIEIRRREKWERQAGVEQHGRSSQRIKITEEIDWSSNLCIFIKIKVRTEENKMLGQDARCLGC